MKETNAVQITVGIITVAQFAITYIPLFQGIFGTEAIALKDGMLIIGVGILLFMIIEMEKQIRLRFQSISKVVDTVQIQLVLVANLSAIAMALIAYHFLFNRAIYCHQVSLDVLRRNVKNGLITRFSAKTNLKAFIQMLL